MVDMKGEDAVSTPAPPSPAAQNVVPLRTILRNFLNLIENCEARRNAGVDVYDKEFQELKQFSESLKSDPDYLCKEGEKSVNRKKNRYKDILPFDYSRVSLSDNGGDIPGVDYHNANFIKGASGSSAYIACQGPLPHTVNDFWRMVVECEVQVIVMACMEQESGKHKCENYWVEEDGVERQFGQVTVWLKKCRNVCPDFLVRTMRIRYPNVRGEIEERNVCQFHYSAWPDHGVPTRVRPLLDMVRLIRDCQTSETLPVLVHCSAGCGRTGTICAIDYVWGLLRLGKLTPDFSLFNLVREMRRQRIAMVQTKDQYILVHRAVKELFQEQLKIIEAHPYANVDHNGLPIDMKHELEEPMYETIDFQSHRTESSPVTIPLPSPPKPNPDVSENNNIPAKPSKPSKIPSSSSASRSKLKKEAENHQRQLEQEKSRGSTSSSGSIREKKGDYVHITPSSVSSKDELSESEKQTDAVDSSPKSDQAGKVTKVQPPAGSPSKASSLLRKPSIVKLKAFFEKSPKDEKEKKPSPGTLLSRAKSDVSSSSRFYSSFTSPFGGSRGTVTPTSTSPTPKGKPVKSPKPDVLVKEKSKNKPPLLAKPTLPIKRSKSLKIHPTDSSSPPTNFSRDLEPSSTPLSSKGNSTFSHSSNENPIKVCVKQVEIPKLQSVVSSSVKPEAFTATTHHSGDTDYERLLSRRESLEPLIRSSRSESDSPPPPRKPSLPSRTHILKDNHNYVNIGSVPNRTKLGIAKALEDVPDGRGTKTMNFNKYETVNPKHMSSLTGSGLTRSQSHVWQPQRPQLTERIYSNDNLLKAQLDHDQSRKYHFSKVETNSDKFSSKEKPLALPPKSSPRVPMQDLVFSNGGLPLSPLLGKPIVRRRMPNTHTYTNYPLERTSPSLGQHYDEPLAPSPSRMNVLNTPLSSLKSNGYANGHCSRGNSSDSSNSLPSTPTQSIDVLYPNMHRSGYGKNNSTPLQKTLYSTHPAPTPKSILKGSLSSTPSESDERLDGGRSLQMNNTSVTTISAGGTKVSQRLTTVGVRERRNSFRQAVWKEAQNDGQQYHHQSQPAPTYLSASVLCQNNAGLPGTDTPDRIGARPHKDYEPIWPEGNTSSNNFRVGSANISSDSRSRSSPPVNTGIGINPNPVKSYAYSNSGPSEESRISSITTPSTPFQSRVDDIKVLLEELRAPMGVALANNSNPASTDASKPKSNHLKYQRSLKAPSRSQYQDQDQAGSLSCFTFRKPSSLESITDQVQVEVDEEYRSLLTPRALLPKSEGLKNTYASVGPSRGPHPERQSNDYVTLTQCRTEAREESRPNGHYNNYHEASGSTPIPPPRTKGKRSHYYKVAEEGGSGDVPDSGSSGDYLGERSIDASSSRAPPLSVWKHDGPRCRSGTSSEDIPDGRPGAHGTQKTELSGGGAAGTSTSPKFVRLFQAKAANVRSKFANWTENSKDRNHSSSEPVHRVGSVTKRAGQSNGSSERREYKSPPPDDNGFKTSLHSSSSSSNAFLATNSNRTTKHQYL